MPTEREIKIKMILRELGIPVNVKGYRYIAYAIEHRIDHGFGKRDTVQMYHKIAREYDDTPTCVERAMRSAIVRVCTVGNIEYLNDLFRYTYSPEGRIPASTFVDTLAEHYLQICDEC